MADEPDSSPGAERRAGSTPATPTDGPFIDDPLGFGETEFINTPTDVGKVYHVNGLNFFTWSFCEVDGIPYTRPNGTTFQQLFTVKSTQDTGPGMNWRPMAAYCRWCDRAPGQDCYRRHRDDLDFEGMRRFF